MELSKRLIDIATMVEKCNSIADIGTDHGYIPIYLIKNKICNKAIASDINKGPVNKAKINVVNEGYSDSINCRLGSGLNTLKKREVDGVIIAGMGGNLIRDILEERIDIFKELKFAVLQPVQNPEILRKHIYEKGYQIVDEELTLDEGIYYEILKIRYAKAPVELEEVFYEVSPMLLKKKHPLAEGFINTKIEKYLKVFNSIEAKSKAAIKRKKDVEEKVEKLKGLLEWL